MVMVQRSVNLEYDKLHIHQLEQLEHASMDTSYYGLMWHSAVNEIVTSKEGDKWIDFTSAIAIANAGHSNPAIIKAIKKSFKNPLVSTYHFPHRYRLELARTMSRLFKEATGQSYIAHFMSSGTEAVEAAIGVALDVSQKKRSVILSFYNSFHGNTRQSAALSGWNGRSQFVDGEGKTIEYIQLPYHHRQERYEGDFNKELKHVFNAHSFKAADVVAIVVEPYQGKGVLVAHDAFIEDIVSFCDQSESLLIMDEIQSGFYRTGTRFAFEKMGIQPDIVCLGKGLTSSLPMSAIVLKEKYAPRDTHLDIATTHSANPLSCIAALANIKYLESNRFESHLKRVVAEFESGIRKIAKEYPNSVGYVDVQGMVASLHIVKDGSASEARARDIAQACFSGGLIVSMPNGRTASFLRFTPPLTIRPQNLKKALSILRAAINEVDA